MPTNGRCCGSAGTLTNLSLAWSRERRRRPTCRTGSARHGAELLGWLERGAHFYVCGDAKRMAKDVETALRDIGVSHGGMGEAAAAAHVAGLKTAGRYQTDVY